MLVVLLVVTALPGVAAAAASESSFVTKTTLTETQRRGHERAAVSPRPKSDEDESARVIVPAPAGAGRWRASVVTPVVRRGLLAAWLIETEPPRVEVGIVDALLSLPPPAR
jgi:hypothetical protein